MRHRQYVRILLVDCERSESSVPAGYLGERGHEIVRCFPENGRSLCVGVDHPVNCPVESLGCDVALIVHETAQELDRRNSGVVCAVRKHIPFVEACQNVSSPITRWTTPAGAAVVDALEALDSDFRPSLVTAVDAALTEIPAVRRRERLPSIAIRLQGSTLHLSMIQSVDYSPVEEETIISRAVRALREADPGVSTADVSVRRS